MKPVHPAGNPHRRGMPPSLLSPSSRSAFPAAAVGDHDAAVSKQPRVTLHEWWLATVEGDDQKIAVAGTLKWKQIFRELNPAPIAKRHSLNVLESEDGTILIISGSLNKSRTLCNGYSNKVCEHFMVGFPHWWQSCNQRYPKLMNSDTGCQPCSSNTSNSGVDSTHFYLEQFQLSVFPAAAEGNHDTAISERPRVTLHEWWLATVEGDDQKIAVAGTLKWKQTLRELNPAPIAKRHSLNVLESEDGTILIISGCLNKSRTLCNGYSNKVCEHFMVGFPLWWQSCNLRYPKLMNSDTGCQPCSLKSQGSSGENQHIAKDGKMQVCQNLMARFRHWCQSCNVRYSDLANSNTGCPPCSSSTSNSIVDSTQFYLEKLEEGKRFHSYATSLMLKFGNSLKSSSRNDSVFLKSSHLSNGTPRFEEHTCDGDIAINENAAASSEAGKGGQRTPVVSLEVPGCREETQHMALTKKASVDEEMPTSVYLDVQNSFSLSNRIPILEECTCDGDITTNGDAAASNDDNERYTAPSKEVNNVEIGLIIGSPSRETGHDAIAIDVSLAPTVQSTNNAVSEVLDSTPATDRKKTPVACLKNQGSWRENQHVASNKKPVGRPKKQISSQEKCQSATRSLGIRSPVSYVLWSPLTRCKSKSLSMSTPEALKLKRSRSGRVIVPALDTRCQSIVYGRDGWISGVIGLDSTAMPKLSESSTHGRKKRKTEMQYYSRRRKPGPT